MKKIGILFGQEDTFPQALINRINSRHVDDVVAEPVRIDKLIQGEPSGYAVIIDRISQDMPFYRAYLKNAALNGAAVINNPFWWSADEKFFNNALATKIGVAVPKTVLLPSHETPPDTGEKSFRNLAYPLDWEGIFNYIGFPAFFKPFAGGGWKHVYRVESPDDFFRAYHETGQLVMMLQEEIVFKEYFRCYCLDCRDIRIMQYDPRQPHHLRYVRGGPAVDPALLQRVHDDVLTLNRCWATTSTRSRSRCATASPTPSTSATRRRTPTSTPWARTTSPGWWRRRPTWPSAKPSCTSTTATTCAGAST